MHRHQTPAWSPWLFFSISLLMGIIFITDPSWQHFFTFFIFLMVAFQTFYKCGVEFLLGLSQTQMDNLKLKRKAEQGAAANP
jgi:hypothetical protein